MTAAFEHLVDHPHLIPKIAEWKFNEYAHQYPGYSIANAEKRLRMWTSKSTIPMAIVAIDNGDLLGMYSLVEHDMDSQHDLSPWLASVFVKQELRGRQIGKMLVMDAVDRSNKLGFTKLYLYTNDQQKWYEKLGWKTIVDTTYREKPVTVMNFDLAQLI